MTFLLYAHEIVEAAQRRTELPAEFATFAYAPARPARAAPRRRRLLAAVLVVIILLIHGASRASAAPTVHSSGQAAGGVSGDAFRISEMGTGENVFAAESSVAQGDGDHMLVVWAGSRGYTHIDENSGDRTIFGRLVNTATGELLGESDIVISPETLISADPDVTYRAGGDEYFVVWSGRDVATGEQEIWSRRISTDGEPLGSPARLTQAGRHGESGPIVQQPAVAYTTGAVHDCYLLVWSGSVEEDDPAGDELEIFGVYVDAEGRALQPVVRLSHMGPDGDEAYQAVTPDIVYNDIQQQFLVVWRGEDYYDGSLGEWEIYGRHLDAVDPHRASYVKRLTHMGPDGATGYDALSPALAFRPDVSNPEYLLAWSGDTEEPGQATNNEYEIFGQRLRANNSQTWGAVELLAPMVRISHMGPDYDAAYDAFYPALSYNSDADAYLATWVGTDGVQEWQIHGQLLNARDGRHEGEQRSLSDLRAPEDATHETYETAVAFSPSTNRFLVLMGGPDDHPLAMGSRRAVYAQLVDGSSGEEIGFNDFIISDMRYRMAEYGSYVPQVAYAADRQQYLVVWMANSNEDGVHQFRLRIYGQRIDARSGARIGPRIAIGTIEQPHSALVAAYSPSVAYSADAGVYLVAWQDMRPIKGVLQAEIWGVRIAATDGQVQGDDLRISFMGPDPSERHFAGQADVVYNSQDQRFLVLWNGLDDRPDQAEERVEVYGQHIDGASGNLLGDNVRISFTPSEAKSATRPAAAYNATLNQYMVAWEALEGPAAGYEVFGRLVEGTTLEPLSETIRYSWTGPDGTADYDGHDPALAYNEAADEYLLVWAKASTQEDSEVRGLRVATNTGKAISSTDFLVGQAGPPLVAGISQAGPDVAYDPANGGYLAVWRAEHGPGSVVSVAGQYLTADGLAEGAPVQLSAQFSGGDADVDPALAAAGEGGFLAVWSGAGSDERVVREDVEIFGRFLTSGSVANNPDDPHEPRQPYRSLVPLAVRR